MFVYTCVFLNRIISFEQLKDNNKYQNKIYPRILVDSHNKKQTDHDQEESNSQIFWTLLKAIKGKITVNTYWESAYAIKQTRIDRMVNTVSYITFLQCS